MTMMSNTLGKSKGKNVKRIIKNKRLSQKLQAEEQKKIDDELAQKTAALKIREDEVTKLSEEQQKREEAVLCKAQKNLLLKPKKLNEAKLLYKPFEKGSVPLFVYFGATAFIFLISFLV